MICLPKTIEGAVARYLSCYEQHFPAEHDNGGERKRLMENVTYYVSLLQRKAPSFYEDKLPKLVNQAASRLLNIDTSTEEGKLDFHKQNRYLILIMIELLKTQPKEEVDFESELKRITVKENLRTKSRHLRRIISELEATEFDCDELGECEADSLYTKVLKEIDEKKAELKSTAYRLAAMEGLPIEEKVEFELKIKPDTKLSLLSRQEIDSIEKSILDYLKTDEGKRLSLNMASIEETTKSCIKNFDVYKLEDQIEITREIFDCCKRYFRQRHFERRNDFLEYLASNPILKPKEGLILKGPDDIPQDVKIKLAHSEMESKRKLDLMDELEKKRSRIDGMMITIDCVDEENIEDENPSPEDDDLDTVKREIETQPELFGRVKEEPRDDYEGDAPSDEEIFEDANYAEEIEASLKLVGGVNSSPMLDQVRNQRPSTSGKTKEKSAEDDDDDIQELGVVRPENKVAIVNIDSDSD